MSDEDRLHRIESKVDTLAEGVASLKEAVAEMIRFEEKIAAHQESLERVRFRQDDMESRLETVEKRIPIYDMWTGWANKTALIVIAALTTALLAVVIA